MAVVAVVTRTFQTSDQATFTEYCSAAITGTYVTGGFTFNPFTIFAGKGSSPLPSSNFLNADWYSPTAHSYVTSFAVVSGVPTCTVKIFTAPGTELANAAAVPNATVPVTIYKRKI